jgi:DNA-binding NtrC family response regulator
VIDDDVDFAKLVMASLRSDEIVFSAVVTLKEARTFIEKREFDLILLDVSLPDGSGAVAVSSFKSLHPEVPIIMVSGETDTQVVVQAIRDGASDYVRKPVDFGNLKKKVSELLEMREEINARRELDESRDSGRIIGKSVKTRQLLREVSRIARSDAPVLLRGESGTGKSLVAEVIHAHSPRSGRPFVTINCPNLPANLLESELFGHEKGAFTGAVRDKIGKFEQADGGTIFLDEIGDLPLELQAKLLRVLQGREFERVGGLKTIRSNVRVIAATNKDLELAISERQFREDLYYRLNILPIVVPPLRERKEDIAALAHDFFKRFKHSSGKPLGTLPAGLLDDFLSYDWPGNIRELFGVLERAAVLSCDGQLRRSDFTLAPTTARTIAPAESQMAPSLAQKQQADSAAIQKIESLQDIQCRALLTTLEREGGSITRAARSLGISRGAIYRRLRKYKISLRRFGL